MNEIKEGIKKDLNIFKDNNFNSNNPISHSNPIKSNDLKYVKTTDGRLYAVRTDRRRIFMPNEWELFFNALRNKNKRKFDFLLNTGARFDEATHIRPQDFDFERNNVRLWKTKTKARKGEKIGKPRTISLSSQYAGRIKKYIERKDIRPDEYLFKQKLVSANALMKRILKKIGVKDYYNFSSHNIRKTHGMYLKALGIDIAEICTRLGHDYDTYISHYGSADIFSEKDMRQIRELLGDLYIRQRRY